MSEIERMEEIKRSIRTILLTLSNKILEVDEFKKEILKVTQKFDCGCEYWFDEYPYIYSYKPLEETNEYISFEKGVDEIVCNEYYIEPELTRVLIRVNNDDYILVLEVGEISVEKVERE
jgi:hypothetical protein